MKLLLGVNSIVTCVLKIPGSAAAIVDCLERQLSLDIVILLKT